MCAEPTSENNEEAGAHKRSISDAQPHALKEQLHPVHRRNSQTVDLFSTDEYSDLPRALLPASINQFLNVDKFKTPGTAFINFFGAFCVYPG
jgi:hypothetical protein